MAHADLRLALVGQGIAFGDVGVDRAVEVHLDAAGQSAAAAVVEEQAPGRAGKGLGARPDVKAGGNEDIKGVRLAHQETAPHDGDRPRVAAP